MGASRKLQGEIDRVLKKVQEGVDVFDSIWNKVYDTENANQKEKFEADLKKEIKKLQRYRDQIKTWIQSSEIKDKKALLDARKVIEREMERFKVCEKETKTKAFSKEGLVQQPKTDPREKAKSETRDWLNNVVGELESQIDYFEADIESLSVKKGKTKPPRLTHLETSITRHKAHIMKLELILRLLDNDELSPEQVNDVKDFLDDYVDRNQEDFEEFSDVDEMYNSLPLDKVESLEDLVAIVPPGLVKVVGSVSTGSTVLGSKTSRAASPVQSPVSLLSTALQSAIVQDQAEETASQDGNSDIVPRTPPSKNGVTGSSVSSTSSGSGSSVTSGSTTTVNSVPARIMGESTMAALSGPGIAQSVMENSTAASLASPLSMAGSTKEDDNTNFPEHKSSPVLADVGVGRGISGGSMVAVTSNQASAGVSGSGFSGNGALGVVQAVSDLAKRNMLGADERVASGGLVQQMISPYSSRVLLQQISKPSDGDSSTESSNVVEGAAIGGRVFSPSVVAGVQWRPHSATSFQAQNETGQFRGRTEIAPDQREKFLLRLQQVQQQGHTNLLGVPHLAAGNHKQFTTQQQNSLLQQLNSQNSSLPSQVGLGLGVQAQGLSSITSASQLQQNPLQQISPSQHILIPTGLKDADAVPGKTEDLQQHQKSADDSNAEPAFNSGLKNHTSEDDLKISHTVDTPIVGLGSLTETSPIPRGTDLSPGLPLQSTQSSAGLGVIGRRSVSDLGAIGDNLSGSTSNSGGMHDQMYNLQMLQAAYCRLPQTKDSERLKSYVPRHPAQVPSSYPQVPAPFVDDPAFWERMSADAMSTDILFFAFYFQQNTYQQYLAARELKKQSWRYHRKYNTWFQRHEEPTFADEVYEKGTYVYFDFRIANDDYQQQGWCQRIKTEFKFEYSFLEDELV